MAETGPFCILLTTAGSDAQADDLARALVERRLAACVNIVHGVCSYFRWNGKLNREDEALLLVKTSRALEPRVREAIRELHSYETPEILVLGIDGGDPAYLAWLGESLGGGD